MFTKRIKIMADIEVHMGKIAVAKGEDNLVASGIGSCLIITLYDPKHKIGALAHTMLYARRLLFEVSSSKEERRKTNPGLPDTKYADTAIDEMLKRMEILGAERKNMEAKLVGGANMFLAFGSDIGKENVSHTKKKLEEEGVVIVGECVGGSQGRSVEFSVATGIVTVKTKF